MRNNTVCKMGFTRFYAAKFYKLKSTIVKVNMTEYHFCKPKI